MINECVQKVSSARNSKVISKVKYDQIVSVLTGNSSDDVNAKFRWWVKEKSFQLLNIPELGLTDVLCTPAKKEVIIILFSFFFSFLFFFKFVVC